MPTTALAQIRWLIRRDMQEALSIESESFDRPWTEEDFLTALRQRNCIGMVAEQNDRIVGYMVYELKKRELHVLNFTVAPWARRLGVGTEMVDKLKSKLRQQGRQRIAVIVREGNLPAQLFFQSCGFWAFDVLREHYEDTGEDGYLMAYLLNGAE